METIDKNERYAWFIEALKDVGIHLLDLSDDWIGYYVFEEFNGDCISYLHPESLAFLQKEGLISQEIQEKSLELARRFRALEHTPLWNVEAVKERAEWREILTLSDRIKEMLNLPADYRLNEEYRYLNEIVLEIDASARLRVHVKTWNEIIRLESDGYVFFCHDGEKICCAEEPILYRIRDWIAQIEAALKAPPVPEEQWYRIGKINYENTLADNLSAVDYRYCLMGDSTHSVYLYPKDRDHFCIEITEGDPYREEPLPYGLLYCAEIDRARLHQWLEILQPYAPNWTE